MVRMRDDIDGIQTQESATFTRGPAMAPTVTKTGQLGQWRPTGDGSSVHVCLGVLIYFEHYYGPFAYGKIVSKLYCVCVHSPS